MMPQRRLSKAATIACALALLAGACGSDGDETGTTTTTSEQSTTTVQTGGELEGAKGPTPAPEASDELVAFNGRMDDHASAAGIDLVAGYAYGPESYDAVTIIALAAVAAGTDGSASASEIVNVTKGGERCSSYAECVPLLAAGADIDYDGVSGPTDMSGNGEPVVGSYAVRVYGADNRIDPTLETFRTVEASDDLQRRPNDPVTVERAGDGVLTIGTLLPETGNTAFLGPATIVGVQMAVADINEAGGYGGQDVVLVEGDSGDVTTDTAVQTVTRELQEKVDAIIGAAASSVSASVIDQITGAGVTMFSPINTSKQFSEYPDNGLYFRLGPSDLLQSVVLADLIATEGHSSLAILHIDDDYGNGFAEDLAASFTASGGEVVDSISYDGTAQTFDAEVDEARRADPDAVALIGFNEVSRLLVTLIEQGLGPQDIPTYLVDYNIVTPLGERLDAASASG